MADTTDTTPGIPRAVVHERILDRAEADPDASLDAIADEVDGATPELVDDVLSEYGDPGVEAARGSGADADDGGTGSTIGRDIDEGESTADAPATAAADGAGAARGDERSADETEGTRADERSNGDGATDRGADESAASGAGDDRDATDAEPPPIEPAALSEPQRETLRAIHRRPDATQAEIASELGVVRATVSNRLTDVDGFEWYDRRAFVERLFDEPVDEAEPRRGDQSVRSTASATARARSEPGDAMAGDECAERPAGETLIDLADRLAAIESSVARLEGALEQHSSSPRSASPHEDATAPEDADEQSSSSPDSQTRQDPLEHRDDADPELLYRGIEAIVAADRLTDREAIALIRRLLRATPAEGNR